MSVAYAISGKFSHLRIDEPRGPSKQDQEIKIDVKKVMTCFLPCFSSGKVTQVAFHGTGRVFEKGRNQRNMGDQISDDSTCDSLL